MDGDDRASARAALEPFRGWKTALLTTYRRDGTPVRTPVTLAVVDDHAYFRTWHSAWKVKRLRADPRVELAPSTSAGKPRGETIRGSVRLLSGAEEDEARRALARRSRVIQGVLVPLAHRLAHYTTMHYEVRPTG